MINLNQLLEIGGRHAEQVLIGLGQDLMPSWLLFDRKNHCDIVGTPFNSDADKFFVEHKMRALMRSKKTVCYSMVSEAWSATAPPDWNPDEGLPQAERPSNRVDRREVVIAVACSATEAIGRQWFILRSPNGAVVELRFEDDYGATGDCPLEGWMTNLLKPSN